MEIKIGVVTHYYNHLGVAVIKLDEPLKLGETVHILGHSTDFIQRVGSMEINHRKVQSVGAGAEVALKVVARVRRGDIVFRVPEGEEIPPPEAEPSGSI